MQVATEILEEESFHHQLSEQETSIFDKETTAHPVDSMQSDSARARPNWINVAARKGA